MEEKRGRKSAAELEALPAVSELPIPMPPPDTLDAEGRGRWHEIVNEHGVDRFRKSDRTMLEHLIKNEQLAARMDLIIAEHGAVVGSVGASNYGQPMENPAVKVRDKAIAQAMTLQVKLKLCPSTRMRADSGSLNRPAKKTKRPWTR
jgi:P27 family predicted phage terminase small subunit